MKRVMIYFWCVDIFWSACGHYVQNREEDTARMQEVYNLEKVSLYFDTLSVKLPHFIMQKNFQYFDTLCILLTWIYRLLWCTDLWVYFGDWRCGTGWFHKSSCVTILNSGCFLYAEKRALRGENEWMNRAACAPGTSRATIGWCVVWGPHHSRCVFLYKQIILTEIQRSGTPSLSTERQLLLFGLRHHYTMLLFSHRLAATWY
jgi:hypothetical protein